MQRAHVDRVATLFSRRLIQTLMVVLQPFSSGSEFILAFCLPSLFLCVTCVFVFFSLIFPPDQEDTDWAGGLYKVTMEFTEDYPSKVSS